MIGFLGVTQYPQGGVPRDLGERRRQRQVACGFAIRSNNSGGARVGRNVARIIETISLIVLALVVCLRPLIGESYDSAGLSLTTALDAVSDPAPLATLILDLAILLGALGWLIARAIGPDRRYRKTGLEWGAAIILIAAVVSCITAGNQRLAINGAIDWLCLPVLTIALVQLMSRPWHRHVLIVCVLASAVVQSSKCFEDSFIGFDDTQAQYEQIREEIWARQGIPLDSPKVALFEQRLLSREASGFMPHSNLTGSYLVLCGFAAVGWAIGSWRRPCDLRAWIAGLAPFVGAAMIIVAIPLTKSRGAMVAALVGIAFWIVISLLRKWIDANHRNVVAIGWGIVVLGIAATIGHGLYHGSLPGYSLTFRWQYWTASSEMIADHALTGVGRENFGRHYLQYKSIDAAEEVSTPHNLFVQAGAEWGILGLVGLIAMLVGGSLAVTRPASTEDASPERAKPTARDTPPGQKEPPLRKNRRGQRKPPVHAGAAACTESLHRSDSVAGAWGPPSYRRLATWGIPIGIALMLIRIPLLGADDPSYVYYNSVMAGLAWMVGLACFAPGNGWRNRVVSTGIAVGVFTFLLHDMINFASFSPGSATTLFALLAVCIAERAPVHRLPACVSGKEPRKDLSADSTADHAALTPKSPQLRTKALCGWTPVMFGLGAIVVVMVLAVLPVARMTSTLARARSMLRAPGASVMAHTPGDPLDLAYLDAVAADPLDPTPCVERAQLWFARSADPVRRTNALTVAIESLDEAIQRDPLHIAHRRQLLQIVAALARTTGATEDYQRAVGAAQRVCDLYPADPGGYVSLADIQMESGRVLKSADLVRDALEAYQWALALDAARPAWVTGRGFRPHERAEIERKMRQAEALHREGV